MMRKLRAGFFSRSLRGKVMLKLLISILHDIDEGLMVMATDLVVNDRKI